MSHSHLSCPKAGSSGIYVSPWILLAHSSLPIIVEKLPVYYNWEYKTFSLSPIFDTLTFIQIAVSIFPSGSVKHNFSELNSKNVYRIKYSRRKDWTSWKWATLTTRSERLSFNSEQRTMAACLRSLCRWTSNWVSFSMVVRLSAWDLRRMEWNSNSRWGRAQVDQAEVESNTSPTRGSLTWEGSRATQTRSAH